jgi:tetratricopeptide (TPR) repeat protein
MKSIRLVTTTLVLGALLASCGPKPRTSESLLDTPGFHFSQGMRLLNRGELGEAEIAFNKALQLENRYVPALSGLALVELGSDNMEKAHDLADEAVSLDKDNAFAWAVRGRVKSVWKKDEDWSKAANRDFEKSLELKPGSEQTLFWYGQAKVAQYDFQGASGLFSDVIAMKGEFAERADEAFEKVQKVLRAAPGSKLGMRIALMEQVNRADLAVLFLEELKLREIFERRADVDPEQTFVPPGEDQTDMESTNLPSDVQDHWARTWIREVLEMGVMEVATDGGFYPDQEVTRAEYALLLQNILIIVFDDPTLATRYIGEDARFNDMPSNSATYNAAALCVDRGVMQPTVEGSFEPMKPVSGAEALLIIRQFQNYLRMTF